MIWVDAHISPAVAKWIASEIGHPACSIRDVGLRDAKDKDIFAAARQASVLTRQSTGYENLIPTLATG